MHIELTSPACLLLAEANIAGSSCQLGVTLQYPPLQLAARESAALLVTGGRADLARRQAEHFLQYHQLPLAGEVEIELAVPSYMGLGSSAITGLSMARSLAALHRLPDADIIAQARAAGLLANNEQLEEQAFLQGGVLLVDRQGQVLQRQPIAQSGDAGDWVWVLVLPRVPAGAPDTLERNLRAALGAAAARLGPETGRLVAEQLFPAAERGDIGLFARSLEQLQSLNYDALKQIGAPHTISSAGEQTLALMRDHGALVCGRALTGLALYALIEGGGPSRAMRRALAEQQGLFGGTVMASLCDNTGAQLQITSEGREG